MQEANAILTLIDPVVKLDEERTERFWAKVHKTNGCWNWTGAVGKPGYGLFNHKKGNFVISTHRLSFFLHGGTCTADKPHVLHSCHNRRCVNPAHLRAGTHADNMQDKEQAERGNHAVGNENGKAKINAEIVRSIRSAYAAGGTSYRKLAKSFGISHHVIMQVVRGETWTHVS